MHYDSAWHGCECKVKIDTVFGVRCDVMGTWLIDIVFGVRWDVMGTWLIDTVFGVQWWAR